MKIHFVTETEAQRWVLRYWSENLAKYIPGATVGTKCDGYAHFNIFVNYALYVNVPTKTAAIFTHREVRDPLKRHFDNVAKKVDWCFAQCGITASLLPKNKTSVLRMYPQQYFHKFKIVFGVVAKPRDSGRKRFEWVNDLSKIPGITIKQAKGDIPLVKMPEFYKLIDYLIILADNEGGPMPLLEAIAMGVPVIAPNVGHCWDMPVLRYDTKADLLKLVRGLVIPKDGWQKSAAKLVSICQKL